jgi:hypothetical protein
VPSALGSDNYPYASVGDYSYIMSVTHVLLTVLDLAY